MEKLQTRDEGISGLATGSYYSTLVFTIQKKKKKKAMQTEINDFLDQRTNIIGKTITLKYQGSDASGETYQPRSAYLEQKPLWP